MTYRLHFLNSRATGACVKHILWPTSLDKERMQALATDSVPAENFSQKYYIEELDDGDAKQRGKQAFVDACMAHRVNTESVDVQRTEENILHALFYNFDDSDMVRDLEAAVDFVLKKYEPLREIQNSTRDWQFLRTVYQRVKNIRGSSNLKIILLLALVTREPELRRRFAELVPDRQRHRVLEGIAGVIRRFTESPYNRSNIALVVNRCMYELREVVFMHKFVAQQSFAPPGDSEAPAPGEKDGTKQKRNLM